MNEIALMTLGSGQVLPRGVSSKAALLHQLKLFNFAIPQGAILLDSGSLDPFENKEAVIALQRELQVRGLATRVAVRSAFAYASQEQESDHPHFPPELNVELSSLESFQAALLKVWNSGKALPAFPQARRDILIMEMAAGKIEGCGNTQTGYEEDAIEFQIKSRPDYSPVHPMEIRKLRMGDTRYLADFRGRVQGLLRLLRHSLGTDNWKISFIDNGDQCVLLQIDPVTTPIPRNEWFTLARQREVLPELPSVFMTSLIASCSERLFSYYANFDRDLPRTRPFVEVFAGRPAMNFSLLCDLVRSLGLPSRLLTQGLGGQFRYHSPFRPLQFWKKIPVLFRMTRSQIRAVGIAKRVARRMASFEASPESTFDSLISDLQGTYTGLLHALFGLSGGMALPTAFLHGFGSLDEHAQRFFGPESELYRSLERARNANGPEREANWRDFLTKFGHRGIFEADVARPRFAEQREALKKSLNAPAAKRSLKKKRPSILYWLTLPLWKYVRGFMEAREKLRADSMLAFSQLRAAFLSKALGLYSRNVLPSPEHFWKLRVEEVLNLDTGWIPDSSFWESREKEILASEKVHLPVLFRRFSSLNEKATLVIEQIGSPLSITQESVVGLAWVLTEPEFNLPAKFDPNRTILVAPALDVGWVPTLSLVAGAIVEIGGDLSYGSSLLRELGLPAVTNFAGAMKRFKTGDELSLQEGEVVALANPS